MNQLRSQATIDRSRFRCYSTSLASLRCLSVEIDLFHITLIKKNRTLWCNLRAAVLSWVLATPARSNTRQSTKRWRQLHAGDLEDPDYVEPVATQPAAYDGVDQAIIHSSLPLLQVDRQLIALVFIINMPVCALTARRQTRTPQHLYIWSILVAVCSCSR